MTYKIALVLFCVLALGGQYRAPVSIPVPPEVSAAPKFARVDALFVQAALGANIKELQEARVALSRSEVAEVRGYAKKMIDEHSALLRQLHANVAGRTAPSPSAADMLVAIYLEHLPNPDFDQHYIQGQIGDHLSAVGIFSAEARNGANRQLRELAAHWVPTLQAHLQLAVDITNHIGGNSPFKSH